MSTVEHIATRVRGTFVLATLFAAVLAHADSPEIPIAPGTTFVIAVSNTTTPPPRSNTPEHVAQGDYETVVTITAVDPEGVSQTAFIDGADESGVRRQASIQRKVLAADLTNSHLQILGFHSADPPIVSGTTSLGPSLAVTHELLTAGKTAYSFRNFLGRDVVSGTLTGSASAKVKFSVLINGQRVDLDAIHATGQMASGSATRPFEQYILDHPRHPVSLRIAYGPRGAGFPFQPDFAREIVRIDFPVQQAIALDAVLEKQCRVEVPGIYFDFNEATLKPLSKQALASIAEVLKKQPQRPVSIEGHTDNIGSDTYNDELSERRAAAVKVALEQDFKIQVASVSTKGQGARKPVESNETLAGRARNRRVELVRECAAGK